LYQQHRPEIVLLDITMPNRDGRDALREILKIDPQAHVVMLSALAMPEVVEDCIKIGARAFVNKEHLARAESFGAELHRALKGAA
jgi:two-component system chemotaxis response regulator CheY